jgi:hypothetical protein
VLLAGVQPQPRAALSDAGVFEMIGESNVVPDVDDALARAYELLAPTLEVV